MSAIIIASEAKKKAVGVLTRPEHLSMLYSTWPCLARELEVEEVSIKALRDRIVWGTCYLPDAVSAVIEDWVSGNGSEATLDVLVCALEKRGLKCIAERLEKELDVGKEQNAQKIVEKETLFNDTLPESIPYYIPRTLVSRYILDIDKLFETAAKVEDVFCFTGIQRFELSNYVKNSTTDNSSMQIQMRRLSERYIILDSEGHFSKIEYRTNEPAHWIEFSKDDENRDKKIVKWVQSSRNIQIIQRQIHLDSNQQQNLSDAQILQTYKDNKNPICFSDCPGMGKSTILIKMGHKIKEMLPDRIIVHFDLRIFVNKMKVQQSTDNRLRLESVLFQILCKPGCNKRTEKLSKIFCSNSVQIELLLDGFDEIFPADVPFCLQIVKDINAIKYTRIWIASRPHFLERIENALNVLGCNIHSFTPVNQKEFLSSYWLSQNQCLSQIKLTKLAEKTLEIISSQTKDQDFAGIPLRCYLIAQVFEERAMDFCTVESEHQELPDLLTISSTFDLFTKMIELKFQKYYRTYGITKYGQGALTQMLMKLAMDLIFPGQLEKLNTDLETQEASVSDLINTGLLLRQGAKDLNGAKFVHQTVAEYFCAQFVSNLIEQCGKGEEWTEERKKFLFQVVLQLDSNDLSALPSSRINREDAIKTQVCITVFGIVELNNIDLLNNKNETQDSRQQKFYKCMIPLAHPVVCYFLNLFLHKEEGTVVPGINFVWGIDSLKDIIWMCVRNNFVNVFKLLTCEPLRNNCTEMFDRDFLFILLHHGQLELVQEGFKYFEKFHKLDLELNLYILSHVGTVGNYSVFEYFCKKKNFNEVLLCENANDILDSIISPSIDESEKVVNQKIQIIRYILSVNFPLITTITKKLLKRCHADILCCLIELGLDIAVQDDSSGNTLLHKYHFSSETNIYNIICSIPIDKFRTLVQIKNNDGETILNQILKKSFVSLSHRMLDKFKTANADFNSCDKYGNNLLMIAIRHEKRVEILVKYLLKEGANPNHVDQRGVSVLFSWKNYSKDMSVLEELVKAGCDVFRQEKGRTFLHSLVTSKYSLSPSKFHAIVKMLIANGKEKLLKTKSEKEPNLTPLQLAFKNIKMDEETLTLLKSVETLNLDKLMEEVG